jgi:hypothetical protein
MRLLTSIYPRWPIADSRVSEEASAQLNSRLLAELQGAIKESASVPLFVLMSGSKAGTVAEVLSRTGVEAIVAHRCLANVPPDERRAPSGHHYTGVANHAIARCTARPIAAALTKGERAD